MSTTPVFHLYFTCQLPGIFTDDSVYIRTKKGRFSDPEYKNYVIGRVLDIKQVGGGFCKKTQFQYTIAAQSALPDGVARLENCDVEGIRLSKDCCIVEGMWVGDEIHLLKEDGTKVIIPPASIECVSFDDNDFNPEATLPDV